MRGMAHGLQFVFALMFGLIIWTHVAAEGAPPCQLCLENERLHFHPYCDSDLQQVKRAVQAELKTLNALDSGKRRPSESKRRRGLQEIEKLLAEALACPDEIQKRTVIDLLLETVMAVNNGQRPPVPRKMDALQTPWFFQRQIHSRVACGKIPAANLQSGPQEDLSRKDPRPSTFWRRPASIASEDLYDGFGRSSLTPIQLKICDYSRPKESYGRNPGFEVDSEGVKIKLKFAEVSSEPFATRIFAALGYNVDPTDYAPWVKVRYARQIFLDFNSRKPLCTHFTFLRLIPLFTLELQKRYDPFDYIAQAVLRDGRHWSGRELKAQLLRDPSRRFPEADSANFRPEVESNIAYLVTVAANVQVKELRGKTIGPWDFEQLDHANHRELRGLGLLAAWLGWFDTRFDNTRLRRERDGRLGHFISDLGGVLGQTRGLLYERGDLPNAFPWTFTRAALRQGRHHLANPLRIAGYKPIAPTAPFTAMTIDDARWMARLIGKLSERQIVEALVAAGYDSSKTRLYTEKLVNRRDRMVMDLGLGDEIPLLRPRGVDKKFSYHPVLEEPVTIDVPGHSQIQAPPGSDCIVHGKLVGGRRAQPPNATHRSAVSYH